MRSPFIVSDLEELSGFSLIINFLKITDITPFSSRIYQTETVFYKHSITKKQIIVCHSQVCPSSTNLGVFKALTILQNSFKHLFYISFDALYYLDYCLRSRISIRNLFHILLTVIKEQFLFTDCSFSTFWVHLFDLPIK